MLPAAVGAKGISTIDNAGQIERRGDRIDDFSLSPPFAGRGSG